MIKNAKNKFRKIVITTLSLSVISTTIPNNSHFTNVTKVYAGAQNITVDYNGKNIDFRPYGQQPIIENGVTYVPVRSVFEAMKVDIDTSLWNSRGIINTTKTIKGKTVKVTIFKNRNNNTHNTLMRAVVLFDDASHNEASEFNLDGEIKIINGRLLVPLRVISEAFGAEVKFDTATKKIIIKDSSY